CRNQIESFNASAATFSDAGFVKPDHDRRPVIFVNNARGDNSQNARVPVAFVNNNRGVARGIEFLGDLSVARGEDLFLDLLPLAILLVQKFREFGCFACIMRQQKPKRFLRGAQAPGRIQSRTEAKANVFGKNWWLNAADLD